VAHEEHSNKKPILPLTVITAVDLGRLSRELEALEDFTLQSAVREAGKQPSLPRTSRGLEEMASQADFNLLKEEDRKKLKNQIDELKKTAPVLHFSFAADPAPAFLTKLITWLRTEIHPAALISIGLQPGIAAGCVVRTRNKYFDFSLRKHLSEQSKLLSQALREKPAS
jgi:F0F1-type ATP synthase delta subunit